MWKIEKYVIIKSLKQTIRIKKSANICEWLLHDLRIFSLNYLKAEKNQQNFRQVLVKKQNKKKVNTGCFKWKIEN